MVDAVGAGRGTLARPGAVERAMKTLENVIRDHLDAYVSDSLSLDDFTAWLVGASWNIERKGDARASQLAFGIELALAEHSSGLLTLVELRSALQNLHERSDCNDIS